MIAREKEEMEWLLYSFSSTAHNTTGEQVDGKDDLDNLYFAIQ
jgi:hypothetical protein